MYSTAERTAKMKNMGDIIYPGSFDPLTSGHVNLVERATRLFDRVLVAVAHNTGKHVLFSPEERVQITRDSLAHLAAVEVKECRGLITQFAREQGIHTVLRGVRNTTDFTYEMQMANMNRTLFAEFDTVFMTPAPQFADLSSTLVREIAFLDGDISAFVPHAVHAALQKKQSR